MRPITAVLLAATFALGACSSDDDGDPSDSDPSDASGLPATSGTGDQTSMPAPGVEPGVIVSSDAPGGPTPLVAGLWDASEDGLSDDEYVSISEDGLYTEYLMNDDIGNCFEREGPFSLTLESADTNEYSLANGADTTLVLVADGDVLNFEFPASDARETWERVPEGTTVGSLQLEGSMACETTVPEEDR